MKLKCDACAKEYNFKDDSIRGFVLIDSPHASIPGGKGCAGFLRSEAKLPSARIEFKPFIEHSDDEHPEGLLWLRRE